MMREIEVPALMSRNYSYRLTKMKSLVVTSCKFEFPIYLSNLSLALIFLIFCISRASMMIARTNAKADRIVAILKLREIEASLSCR